MILELCYKNQKEFSSLCKTREKSDVLSLTNGVVAMTCNPHVVPYNRTSIYSIHKTSNNTIYIQYLYIYIYISIYMYILYIYTISYSTMYILRLFFGTLGAEMFTHTNSPNSRTRPDSEMAWLYHHAKNHRMSTFLVGQFLTEISFYWEPRINQNKASEGLHCLHPKVP